MSARSRSFHPVLPSSSGMGGVAPAWLELRLTDDRLRILDVRVDHASSDESGPRLRQRTRSGPSAAFLQGHVPGAVPLDVRAALLDPSGDVVSAPELAMVMSGLGVGDDHTVVIVDDGRPESANAAAWALDRYGHRDVHVLEGGFARWVGEGRTTTRAIVRHRAASFTARVPS